MANSESIRKIDKSEIDFSKIYGNSVDALSGSGKTKKVSSQYWGDNGELTFDESTGLVMENGVGLGFINPEDVNPDKNYTSNGWGPINSSTNSSNLNDRGYGTVSEYNNYVSKQNNQGIKGVKRSATSKNREFNGPTTTLSEKAPNKIDLPDSIIRIADNPNKEYIGNLQEYFEQLKKKTGETSYKHLCGALTSDQLKFKGLMTDDGRTASGKDLARSIFETDCVPDGHTKNGYEVNPSNVVDTFESVIKQNHGSLENLVISFDKGGGFSSTHGHVMLVSKIEDGHVYFVDDTNHSIVNGKYGAVSMTVPEFEEKYLQNNHNPNFMTHIV